MHYLHACPDSMGGGYPWELLCQLAGITDLETLREVWERMSVAKQLYADEAKRDEAKRQQRD